MKTKVDPIFWGVGLLMALVVAAFTRFAVAVPAAQTTSEILIKPYAEWAERKDLKPGFQLNADALTGLPEATYVEAAKTETARYDWRIWSRVDQPTADFSIGLAVSERAVFPRLPVRERLAGLTDLRRVRYFFDARPDMLNTQFGDLETQSFRVRGQSDTDKQCIGFYGTSDDGRRAVTGWYCARPDRDVRLSLVRCLIERVVVDGRPVDPSRIRPEC